MLKKLLVSLAFCAALFILSSASYQAEGVTIGRLSAYGCVRLTLAGKTVTMGACPIRTNRVYYRVMIQ